MTPQKQFNAWPLACVTQLYHNYYILDVLFLNGLFKHRSYLEYSAMLNSMYPMPIFCKSKAFQVFTISLKVNFDCLFSSFKFSHSLFSLITLLLQNTCLGPVATLAPKITQRDSIYYNAADQCLGLIIG